jgi:hypothetical protein
MVRLELEREGHTVPCGEFVSLEAIVLAVDGMEDRGTFPEGHEVIAITEDGKRFMYTDKWEALQ